jgi:hypothetical protein
MFFDAPFSLFHGSLFSREHFFFFLADIFFFQEGCFFLRALTSRHLLVAWEKALPPL